MATEIQILPSGQTLPGDGETKQFTPQVGEVTQFAAQYVRMSKEHQKYSPENQSAAICSYADRHGLTVIRSYADFGRSGLRLDGRPALQRLLSDIRSGDTPFRIILVFDVSRWGRFQDTDESAYYEFMCRQAGFEVRYCAEPFENDGSMYAGLVKSLKRLMAAEYSRELSAKIFAAKCNYATRGFWMGGPPGYGLRRLLVDERGQPRTILEPGQRKGIHTDRVLLVPGPDHEVRVVREIFRAFVSDGMTRSQIAHELNRKGILNEFGRRWTKYTVYQVLSNEKYVGDNVYNRQSNKLRGKVVKNPSEAWIRAEGAFEPLIDAKSFQSARRIIASQRTCLSNEEALRRLRLCMVKHGRLTSTIINNSKGLPSTQTYRERFGSLERAYELVGGRAEWVRHCKKERRKLFAVKQEILRRFIETIEQDNGHVCQCNKTGFLLIDGTFSVAVKVANCHLARHILRWDFVVTTPADVMIAVRMEEHSDSMMDYYLLPRSFIKAGSVCLPLDDPRWAAHRFTSLDGLLGRLYQIQVREFEKAAGHDNARSRNDARKKSPATGRALSRTGRSKLRRSIISGP